MEEVSIQTAHKKYQKRVWASCRLGRSSLWMETQLKRISKNHPESGGHNHKSVRAEQKPALAEDHNSFEMWKMTVRTEQLFCIAKTTGSNIHTWETEAKTDGIKAIPCPLLWVLQLVKQQTVMWQVPGLIPTPDSTWPGVDSALHPSVGR